MNNRRTYAAGLVLALAAANSIWTSRSLGQATAQASIDATTIVRYRATLAGHDGTWTVAPSAVSCEASVSSDPTPTVTIRAIHVSPTYFTSDVGLGTGTVSVGFTSLVVDAAPTAIVLQTVIGPTGSADFSATSITTSAQGIANYQTNGSSCNALIGAGAPCSGPFDLSLVPAGTTGSILSGSITPTGAIRPFSLVFYGSYPFVSGRTWGRLDVRAEIVGSVAAAQPSCPADFDHSGGLAVQDIFAFLNTWFAGDPAADFNHVGGLSVQDIFDFLNAWFAGCP